MIPLRARGNQSIRKKPMSFGRAPLTIQIWMTPGTAQSSEVISGNLHQFRLPFTVFFPPRVSQNVLVSPVPTFTPPSLIIVTTVALQFNNLYWRILFDNSDALKWENFEMTISWDVLVGVYPWILLTKINRYLGFLHDVGIFAIPDMKIFLGDQYEWISGV